jgi:hypothetical protein
MFVEIATPCGDLVVHFGNAVLDRHGAPGLFAAAICPSRERGWDNVRRSQTG